MGAGSGFPELCLVQPRILAGQEGTPGPLLSQSRITEPWNGLWEGRKESFLCARLPQPSLAMGTKPLRVAIPVSCGAVGGLSPKLSLDLCWVSPCLFPPALQCPALLLTLLRLSLCPIMELELEHSLNEAVEIW